MPQYQVPQFITVEDKVIGPFTIKQFLYVGSAGLLILGAYAILQSFLFWPVAIIFGGAGASFAFLTMNGQPLPIVFKNAVFYYLRPRLYTWKKEGPTMLAQKTKKPETSMPTPIKGIPKLSESKLTDLAWSLDIKERIKN